MRISNWVFQTAEGALIAIMSLCGTAALASSQLYTSFQGFIRVRVPGIVPYTALIIGAVLFIIGVFLIMVKNRGRGFFAALVVLVSVPSILSFDSLDLFRLLKIDSVRAQFTTKFNTAEMTALGAVIIICYLLINFMSLLRKSRNDLAAQGADLSGTDRVYFKSHFGLLAITAIALTIAVLITGLAWGIELAARSAMAHWSGSLFVVGLGCVLLITSSIYWIVSRRKL
jgi:uncharacterized membrane protein YiaA